MGYAKYNTEIFTKFLKCLGFKEKEFLEDEDQIKFIHPEKPRLYSNRNGITLPTARVQTKWLLEVIIEELIKFYGFTIAEIQECAEGYNLEV